MKSPPDRQPGTTQGVVLLLLSTLPIMGIVLIAPVLPRIMLHFQAVRGAEFLVPVALTVPALCIALLSPVAGTIADIFGRRRLLLFALVFYAICGVAPIFLDSIGAIIVSRIGVGIAESAIMTCSTTLLGDYFESAEREKWLAYQFGLVSIAATFLFVIGGVLGNANWRLPFALYAVSLLMLVAFATLTWEPARRQEPSAVRRAFPLQSLLGICGITVFAAIMFYIVPLQIGFVLGARGLHSPALIGLVSAVANIAVTIGAITFRRVARLRVGILLSMGLLVSGAGLVAVAHATELPFILAAAVLNQLGCGLMLPTLLTWAMRGLPFELRGRGTGLWVSSFFFGQFASPLVIVALAKPFGGLLGGVQSYGVLALVACVIAIATAAASHPSSTDTLTGGREPNTGAAIQ